MNDAAQKVQNQSQDDVLKTIQTTVVPVSAGVGKEAERPVSDFVIHSEAQPVLDKEVQEIGVEAVSDKPKLTQEHEQIGIKHSLENNVPNIEPSGNIKFPLTNEETATIEKDKNVGASAYWLMILIKKIKKAIFRND